jgi:hypothetical protein
MSPTETAAQRRSDIRTITRVLQAFPTKLAGGVSSPGDPDWDVARQAWAAVDQQPAAVALPESGHDIVAIVEFSREQGFRVAARGTGHNAHPLEHPLADSILVKTSRAREVEIDAQRRRARVEAGALWMDVTVPAGEHGWAPMAGSSPDLGLGAPYIMFATGAAPSTELRAVVEEQLRGVKQALSPWSADHGEPELRPPAGRQLDAVGKRVDIPSAAGSQGEARPWGRDPVKSPDPPDRIPEFVGLQSPARPRCSSGAARQCAPGTPSRPAQW